MLTRKRKLQSTTKIEKKQKNSLYALQEFNCIDEYINYINNHSSLSDICKAAIIGEAYHYHPYTNYIDMITNSEVINLLFWKKAEYYYRKCYRLYIQSSEKNITDKFIVGSALNNIAIICKDKDPKANETPYYLFCIHMAALKFKCPEAITNYAHACNETFESIE